MEPRLARLMIGSTQLAPATGRTAVVKGGQVGFPAEGGGILIATTAKWLFCDPARLGADVVIVDEGWQGDCASIAALGAFAGQIVLIGDPGQIDPVVTGRTTRWRDRADGPHRAAHFRDAGVDPGRHLLVEAWDVDEVCAAATWLQCTAAGVPAVVVTGDCLAQQSRRWWPTPAAVQLLEKQTPRAQASRPQVASWPA